MTSRTTLILLALSGLLAASGNAQIAAPLVGEPAPPLVIGTWLKGSPITHWSRGKVYVIDIWAPWCGPCLGGMQHLTDLQRTNAARGLVVIGMTGPDRYGSTLEKAKNVVAERGQAIGYRIAWDEAHRMYDVWMARERDEGWPWSFIIGRDGRVAFVGHPEKLDHALEEVLSGTYDIDAAARRYGVRAAALEVVPQFLDAYHGKRWAEADARFSTMLSIDPAVGVEYVAHEYKILAIGLNDSGRAAVFGREIVRRFQADARAMVELAVTVIDPKLGVAVRDYDLARLCAENAVAATHEEDGGMFALLASVQFAAGDARRAVQAQERVVALTSGPEREEAKKVLASYAKGVSEPRH
ncbi:MAG: TlpA family protein disulfide reductase [Acidobacteriia bacterium]|nr:TlpA family protein disulfide reductase [Terriglobia bacterium]